MEERIEGRKPSVDSLVALWRELSPKEQFALVDSNNRPDLKTFLTTEQRLLFPSLFLAADLIPKNHIIVGDVGPSRFHVDDLEFIHYLKSNESAISGEEMRNRAFALHADLGLADGAYLLVHESEIPAGLQDKHIVLPGTLLCHSDTRENVVLVLIYDRGHWRLEPVWLNRAWNFASCLARLKVRLAR